MLDVNVGISSHPISLCDVKPNFCRTLRLHLSPFISFQTCVNVIIFVFLSEMYHLKLQLAALVNYIVTGYIRLSQLQMPVTEQFWSIRLRCLLVFDVYVIAGA